MVDYAVTRIVMDNAVARLVFAPPELIQLIRYDLAYMAQDAFTPSADDGWDGWLRLMTSEGFTSAGLVPAIRRLLEKYKVPYAFTDSRQRPDDDLPLHSGFQLRPYQQDLVQRALSMSRGVLDSPPRCHRATDRVWRSEMALAAAIDVSVGDSLLGPDGSPRIVLARFEGHSGLHAIQPARGVPFHVTPNHVLVVDEGTPWLVEVTVSDWLAWPKARQVRSSLVLSLGAEGRCAFAVAPLGPIEPFVGWTLDGDNRYLSESFVVCHNSGKTLMGAAIIDANPLPTLWIAPTKGIVHQTVRALSKLPLGPDGVVELTGGWPKPPAKAKALEAARVVVTTAATAVRMPESFYRTRHIMIVDEFHHSSAKSYQDINLLAKSVYYRYGMTGTHFRSDENSELLMDAFLSEVIGRVEVQQLIDLGFLAPVDFVFVPVEEPKLGPCSMDQAYRIGILNHQRRNEWIAWSAQTLMAMGKRVIVLVKLVEHGEKLGRMIPGSRFVRGAGGSGEDRVTDEEVRGAIADFNEGRCPCLVGTSVLGEGIDLPAADALVYAKGGSAAVTVTQDVFRVLTASVGKERAIVVDFADRHHEALLAQSASRGRIYSREDAFTVEVLPQPMALPEWLARHHR